MVEGNLERIGDKTQPSGFNYTPTMVGQPEFGDGMRAPVGGYLRELEFHEETARTHKYYLEAVNWTPI